MRLQRPPQGVDRGLVNRKRIVGGGTCLREHHLAPLSFPVHLDLVAAIFCL